MSRYNIILTTSNQIWTQCDIIHMNSLDKYNIGVHCINHLWKNIHICQRDKLFGISCIFYNIGSSENMIFLCVTWWKHSSFLIYTMPKVFYHNICVNWCCCLLKINLWKKDHLILIKVMLCTSHHKIKNLYFFHKKSTPIITNYIFICFKL